MSVPVILRTPGASYLRQSHTKPLLDQLQRWMIVNRQKITDGSATAKALDYGLRRRVR